MDLNAHLKLSLAALRRALKSCHADSNNNNNNNNKPWISCDLLGIKCSDARHPGAVVPEWCTFTIHPTASQFALSADARCMIESEPCVAEWCTVPGWIIPSALVQQTSASTGESKSETQSETEPDSKRFVVLCHSETSVRLAIGYLVPRKMHVKFLSVAKQRLWKHDWHLRAQRWKFQRHLTHNRVDASYPTMDESKNATTEPADDKLGQVSPPQVAWYQRVFERPRRKISPRHPGMQLFLQSPSLAEWVQIAALEMRKSFVNRMKCLAYCMQRLASTDPLACQLVYEIFGHRHFSVDRAMSLVCEIGADGPRILQSLRQYTPIRDWNPPANIKPTIRQWVLSGCKSAFPKLVMPEFITCPQVRAAHEWLSTTHDPDQQLLLLQHVETIVEHF